MFSKKESFTLFPRGFSHDRLNDDLAQDKAEVEKFYNKLMDNNLNITFALNELKKQETLYKAYTQFLIFKDKSETKLFKETTLPFIYGEYSMTPLYTDFRLDDILERKFTSEIRLKAAKQGDYFEVDKHNYSIGDIDFPFEDIFNESFWGKSTSGKLFAPHYIFSEFSYNDNVNWFNKKNHPITQEESNNIWLQPWHMVWLKVAEINYIREELEITFNVYIKYIKELIDLLEKQPATPTDNVSPMPPEQPETTPTEEYKLSDWYKNLNENYQEQIDDILAKQQGFKPYINKLWELKFIIIKYSKPSLNVKKCSIADFRRIINELVKTPYQGKFKDWQSFLSLKFECFRRCSKIENPLKYQKIKEQLQIN